nr:hypothetical protein CFP56_13155 [Quercus suber]
MWTWPEVSYDLLVCKELCNTPLPRYVFTKVFGVWRVRTLQNSALLSLDHCKVSGTSSSEVRLRGTTHLRSPVGADQTANRYHQRLETSAAIIGAVGIEVKNSGCSHPTEGIAYFFSSALDVQAVNMRVFGLDNPGSEKSTLVIAVLKKYHLVFPFASSVTLEMAR